MPPSPVRFSDLPTARCSIIIAVRHIPKMVIPTHLFYSQMFTMHGYFLAPRQLAKNLGTFPMADGTGDAMAELDAKGFD